MNSVSAGIQIVPVFRYDISRLVREGKNDLVIEVVTILERQYYSLIKLTDITTRFTTPKPSAKSSITGIVTPYSISSTR